MPKIEMLSRQQGSINGRDIDWFEEGEVYDLPSDSTLAQEFVNAQWAEYINEPDECKPEPGPTETKPVKTAGQSKKAK